MGLKVRRAELARAFGVGPSTITWYTQQGLLKPAEIVNNRYIYDYDECQERFSKIMKLRKEGKKVREIREMMVEQRELFKKEASK